MNPPDENEGPYAGTAVCVLMQILTSIKKGQSNEGIEEEKGKYKLLKMTNIDSFLSIIWPEIHVDELHNDC